MAEDMAIKDVHYDAATRRYHGALTLYLPNGIFVTQVSVAGAPAWGRTRAIEALKGAARAQLPHTRIEP